MESLERRIASPVLPNAPPPKQQTAELNIPGFLKVIQWGAPDRAAQNQAIHLVYSPEKIATIERQMRGKTKQSENQTGVAEYLQNQPHAIAP